MGNLIAEAVLGPETLVREITEIAFEEAPRRFALCRIDEEDDDAWLCGWGIDFDDEAVLVGVNDGISGSFQSAESARRFAARLKRADRVELVWIDPPNREISGTALTAEATPQAACRE